MIISRRELLRLAGLTAGGGPGRVSTNAGRRTGRRGTPRFRSAGRDATGSTAPADAAPLDKQVLYESAAEPKHLDVSRDIYNAGAALNWGSEPLLRRDQDQNIVPALAESYTAGPNAEYFDFVIREDAQLERRHADHRRRLRVHLPPPGRPKLDNPWTWFFYDIKGVQG